MIKNRVAIVYTSGPKGRLARALDDLNFVSVMRKIGIFDVSLVVIEERAKDARRKALLEIERQGDCGAK